MRPNDLINVRETEHLIQAVNFRSLISHIATFFFNFPSQHHDRIVTMNSCDVISPDVYIPLRLGPYTSVITMFTSFFFKVFYENNYPALGLFIGPYANAANQQNK